ncbi:hypothetical protein GCM10018779_61630 [Streptomyces griseocarneus]|nr:hypothetical protein GCM10018779_61630 [Streptomyces griseocarneus]
MVSFLRMRWSREDARRCSLGSRATGRTRGVTAGGVQGRLAHERTGQAEAELDKFREESACVRKEKRELSDLVGAYAAMIAQLAR